MAAALTSLLTFFLGLVLGHWLAIGRDKRKEFNDAVVPVRNWLLRAKDAPNPYAKWPSDEELDRFIHYLRSWQRAPFRKHLSRYRELHNTQQVQDSYGQASYRSTTEIRCELIKLFKYTGRR